MQAMEQLAERLAKRLRKQLIRRHRVLNRGRMIHIRRTVRRNLAHGGLPLKLAYRERRRQFPRLVLLVDISHSMERYSRLLARFARALVLTFREAEAFVFHTRLYRVTDQFRQQDVETMRRQLDKLAPLWMGGTRIADSLHSFNCQYARRLVNSRSIVIIMSDGFDSDSPESLERELRLLRTRAKRLLWLNPMLGREDYSPDEGTMAVALPLLDLIAPAHSVASLETVLDYLIQAHTRK
ncbi:MAG: VWA domain-containing protein [Candidatus Competibacteraceae bacterium]